MSMIIDEFSYLCFQFEAIYHHIDYFHIDAVVWYLLLRSILYKKTDLRMRSGRRWLGIDMGMGSLVQQAQNKRDLSDIFIIL